MHIPWGEKAFCHLSNIFVDMMDVFWGHHRQNAPFSAFGSHVNNGPPLPTPHPQFSGALPSLPLPNT